MRSLFADSASRTRKSSGARRRLKKMRAPLGLKGTGAAVKFRASSFNSQASAPPGEHTLELSRGMRRYARLVAVAGEAISCNL